MDVDFSPTGREFVAGSYDRSIRIFRYNGGHSHEVYTTKRMQRVFAVRFTGDATYVLSGSDDFNLRVWKVCRLAPYCVSAVLRNQRRHAGKPRELCALLHAFMPQGWRQHVSLGCALH